MVSTAQCNGRKSREKSPSAERKSAKYWSVRRRQYESSRSRAPTRCKYIPGIYIIFYGVVFKSKFQDNAEERDIPHGHANYITQADLTEFGNSLLSSVTRSIEDISAQIAVTVNRNVAEFSQVRTSSRPSARKSGLPVRRSAAINASHVRVEH